MTSGRWPHPSGFGTSPIPKAKRINGHTACKTLAQNTDPQNTVAVRIMVCKEASERRGWGTARHTTCSTCSNWVRLELCTRLLPWHPTQGNTPARKAGTAGVGPQACSTQTTPMQPPAVPGPSQRSVGLGRGHYWIWAQDLSKCHHP